jgi:hypothetical protein
MHATNGYRDGIAHAKALHVQEGFDEGFVLGAEVGLRVGWILGCLEGVVKGLRSVAAGGSSGAGTGAAGRVGRVTGKDGETANRGQVDDSAVFDGSSKMDGDEINDDRGEELLGEARRLLKRAREETRVERLLGREWVDEEGIWKWDVPDQHGVAGDDFTIRQVADAHPVLVKWMMVLREKGEEWRIRLDLPSFEQEENG